ncbi:Pheromone B alpha 3 receptor, partial [Termitomyces sp. T112]
MPAVTTSFSVLSCISFVLVLISLPWHLKSPLYNTGICLYMAWTSLGCLNLFINSIMWRDTMSNIAPVWCDISTKFMTIVGIALPVASLCISRHLYHLTARCAPKFKIDGWRGLLLDLSIGLGVPIVY